MVRYVQLALGGIAQLADPSALSLLTADLPGTGMSLFRCEFQSGRAELATSAFESNTSFPKVDIQRIMKQWVGNAHGGINRLGLRGRSVRVASVSAAIKVAGNYLHDRNGDNAVPAPNRKEQAWLLRLTASPGEHSLAVTSAF